jgi:hypothetical protein
MTSVACSICTFTLSQALLASITEKSRTPETQSIVSVGIFVVGYWVVYFALRARVQKGLVRFGILHAVGPCAGTPGAKLFFVFASEIFWIVSLGVGNLYLLRLGYSANAAAAIAQWGVNLLIWLPLLPVWEWFALVYLPSWKLAPHWRTPGKQPGI